MPVVGPFVLGEPHIAIDAEQRLLAVTAQAEPGVRETLCQRVDEIAKRIAQFLFEQVAVFQEPLPALVEVQRLQERDSLLAEAFERTLRHDLPTRCSQVSSSMTSTPSSVASLSLERAPGPSTSRSVLAEPDPATLA